MHHQRIPEVDDKARLWVVMRGPDGRLQEQIDSGRLADLHPAQSAQEVADALLIAAGELEVAANRLW